jgi:hypothetical protein
MTTWAAALDQIEEQIRLGQEALSAESFELELPEFAPPRDLPPIPEELRARALGLVERNAEITQQLEAARDTISAKLTASSPQTTRVKSQYSQAPIPMYVDRSV